jgi:hypothetical protein
MFLYKCMGANRTVFWVTSEKGSCNGTLVTNAKTRDGVRRASTNERHKTDVFILGPLKIIVLFNYLRLQF